MSETRVSSRGQIAGLGATLTTCLTTALLLMFAVAALGPFITEDLGIGRTEFGLISGVMFVAAALASPKSGALVDTVALRRMLAVVFVLGIVALALAGITVSFLGLLAAAAISGVGVTIGNPVINQLISLHAPRAHQGTLMGIAYSGAQLSALFAGLVLPTVALAVGWRGAMLVAIVIPVAGLVAMRFTVPETPAGKRERLSRADRPSGRYPGIKWMSAYAFLMGSAATGVPAYLALFAVDELGKTPSEAGITVALLGLAGIPGRVWWSRWTHRAHNPAVPLAVLAGASVGVQLMLLVAPLGGPATAWLLWPGSIFFGLIALAWMPVAMVAVIAAVPTGIAGRAVGIVQSATFAGAAVTPVFIGFLVDLQGNYSGAWLAMVACFVIAVLVAVKPARSNTIRLPLTDAAEGST